MNQIEEDLQAGTPDTQPYYRPQILEDGRQGSRPVIGMRGEGLDSKHSEATPNRQHHENLHPDGRSRPPQNMGE